MHELPSIYLLHGCVNRPNEAESQYGASVEGGELRISFTGGNWCTGKAREAEAVMKCGESNRIVEAKESSQCHYSIIFETPAACTVLV